MKSNSNEENRISGKEFEKEMREAGALLPDKEPEEKKPEKDDRKSEDKKPDDKKDDKKPEEKKPEEKKPEEKKNEKDEKKPDGEKPEDKPDEKKPEDKSDEKKPEEKKPEKEESGAAENKPEKDVKKTDEKKRGLPTAVKVLLIAAGVLAVSYLAVAFYLNTHFAFNIYVNGLDVSMMPIDDANEMLCAKKGTDYELVITESGNEVAYLNDRDINSGYDYTRELSRLKSEEKPLEWIPYLTYTRKFDIEPDLVFDEKAAREKILELYPVKHTQSEYKSSVNIMKSMANGYILIKTDEVQPDQAKLIDCIITAMHKLEPSMELSDTYYDVEIPYTELQQEAIDLFEKIDAIQNTKIIFTDYGQEKQIDKDTLSGFLKTDSQGRFVVDKEGTPTLDEDKIAEYSEEIGEDFTTKDKKMWWKKYNGGTVSVNSGTYGKTVDTEAVGSRIERLLKNTEDYTGPPDYEVDPNADPNAPDEIGNTYIEVDMTRQKLYYLKDGKLFMTSDVVTGNSGRHHDTTQLMAYIYYMQRDRVLVGEDYRTPVKYWMAFHNHEGLHDANWRRSFGGDIYKYNGSHGCVNLPTSFAAELYDNVYVGLPVITYY
ncbi:MAG: L,D-transpeptidase family protein [Lachnospiraceae bacterium]|nr:L,D-transpeptidase family protein [Lachnospiraceae bacterium]